MNLPAIVFPEYDSFRVKKNAKHYYWNREEERFYTTTPYKMSVQDLTKALVAHNVKMPFDSIVTMDMGTSVCPHCQSKYVGNPVFCTNTVRWAKEAGGYSDRWHRGDYHKGDRVITGEGYYKNNFVVSEVKTDLCDSEVKWDLQDKFDEQKSFFSFLATIQYCASHPENLLEKYKHTLPTGVAAEYRMQLLEDQNMLLQGQVSQLQGALRQIAEKMNSAGHALSFGF